MFVTLTTAQIDAALPRIAKGLKQYLWLQANQHLGERFQKRFNGFYRVRRNEGWRNDFFVLMQRLQRKRATFRTVLNELTKTTKRLEASFASKLLATLNPDMPVIDSIVLRNLRMRLPPYSAASLSDRVTITCKLYVRLQACFTKYLKSANGRYLVTRFKRCYPNARITEVKMLDLVLWQTRKKNR